MHKRLFSVTTFIMSKKDYIPNYRRVSVVATTAVDAIDATILSKNEYIESVECLYNIDIIL